MAKYIEETLKHCGKCEKETLHRRANSKSSGFAILVHIILVLCTMGIWLGLILFYKLLFVKFGGWKCGEC